MKRYLVKSKLGIGRDFSVYEGDTETNKLYFIDAKMGLGTKAEIQDGNGNVIYKAKGKVINIPRTMEFYSPDGKEVAKLKAHISPLRSKMTMELADGTAWKLEGNLIQKNFQIYVGDTKIIDINQKWLTIRDRYFVEIDESADIALALGLIWAVDVWREGNNN